MSRSLQFEKKVRFWFWTEPETGAVDGDGIETTSERAGVMRPCHPLEHPAFHVVLSVISNGYGA
jgi:hypothetical protein